MERKTNNMLPSEKYLAWMKEQLHNKEKLAMTPSKKINAIATDLLKLNPNLSVHSAYLNAIITHLDREKLDAVPEVKNTVEPQFKEGKFIKVNEGDLQKTIDTQDIKVTVETDGKKLVLDIPYNADIFGWETKLNILLRWLTFEQSSIDLILGSNPDYKKCTCKP